MDTVSPVVGRMVTITERTFGGSIPRFLAYVLGVIVPTPDGRSILMCVHTLDNFDIGLFLDVSVVLLF